MESLKRLAKIFAIFLIISCAQNLPKPPPANRSPASATAFSCNILNAPRTAINLHIFYQCAEDLVFDLINKEFPALLFEDIVIIELESESDFFTAVPPYVGYIPFKESTFRITVNKTAFFKNIPLDAMTAILAHELNHVLDYKNGNALSMVGLGIAYAQEKERYRYEKLTDLKTIFDGHAEGLVSYRNWLYQNIKPEAVIQKKKSYYQPHEIKSINEAINRFPALRLYWIKNVPLNQQDIERDIVNFSIPTEPSY